MQKKTIIIISILIVAVLTSFGIYYLFVINRNDNNKEQKENALKFKKEYEDLNSNTDLKKITINENNPFIYISYDELLAKLNNRESFVLYLGSSSDNYTRSTVPTLIDVASQSDLSIIYYLNIKDTSSEINDKLETLKNKLGKDNIITPNLISIINGKVKDTVSGISPKQINPKMELTEEMINDTKQYFEQFISNHVKTSAACSSSNSRNC